MRAVLDANVYVSAFLNTQGPPQQIISLWQQQAFDLLTSEPILSEIAAVLRYPHIAALHKLPEAELAQFLALLRDESHLIVPTQQLSVSPDESDNRYLECAMAGGAEYIVTGDKKHLLPIGTYQGIRLVSPATFLTVLTLDP